ncbi:MAG TPA: universal stress protein [Planctomycetota bacterium]|nr:universal stress protein [Planctomycetota bacterium]
MGLELEQVLVAIDFGEASLVALDRAVALAADYQADVTLIHVVEPPFFGFAVDGMQDAVEDAADRLHAIVRERVRDLRRLHGWRGVVLTEVLVGSPADEIVDAIERLDVGVLVLGLRPASALARAVRPSTTGKVLERAHCPVVVVRAPTWARHEPEAEKVARAALRAA